MRADWPDRVEKLVGHDGMEMILALNFMMDGVPMVFCGNELADTAKLSMFANRFHMGAFEVTDRAATGAHVTRRMEIVKTFNHLRKTVPALSDGITEWHDTAHPEKVLMFSRVTLDDRVTFMCNFSKETVTLTVEDVGDNLLIAHDADKNGDTVTLKEFGYIACRTE